MLASANVGQSAAWGPERSVAQRYLALAMGCRKTVIEEVSDLALPALAALFDVYARSAAAARRERGELLFHDLLVLARDVLARHESVRRSVRSRFRYLLVDEFQDTDPLQLEIAELIGRPVVSSPEPDRLFHVGDPEPGRLFYVGDPQQSIYRFRGADLEAYLAARQHFVASGGRVTALTCNFRSVPGILTFVDECFKELLPDFRPLTGVRSPLGNAPVVHVVGGPFAEKRKADEQRQQEAEDCVAVIRRALTEAWPVEGETPRGHDGPCGSATSPSCYRAVRVSVSSRRRSTGPASATALRASSSSTAARRSASSSPSAVRSARPAIASRWCRC